MLLHNGLSHTIPLNDQSVDSGLRSNIFSPYLKRFLWRVELQN
jgi:hypothetical protein